MESFSVNDIYEIRLASLISNIDKDVIIELYQPLIGSISTILYLSLLKQKRNEEDEDVIFTHAQLVSATQIEPNALETSMNSLEAVGLLRSYVKRGENNNNYIYVLYAPKTPKEFFDDVLFKGLLVQSIGEKEAKRLAEHYRVDLKIPSDYQEKSASFVDVFNPDYDSSSFRKDFGKDILGHESGRVKIAFSYDLFFKSLFENSMINNDSLSKKDIKEIERISTLFGLDEKTMAMLVIDTYNPNSENHLDYQLLVEKAKEQVRYPFLQKKIRGRSKLSGDGIINKKIRLMEKTSPANWLKLLQNNTTPANADLNIVNELSLNYGFSNGVINAIVDYVLHKNKNILSKNYCEKIASSLARENISVTVDAMNYLNKITILSKNNNTIKNIEPKDEKTDSKNEKESSLSDSEMEDILKLFDGNK